MKLTSDVVLLRICPEESTPQVLLVQREKDPYKGSWALPGGHVEEGESTKQAAERELKEETGLEFGNLRFLHLADEPNRDPRGRYVSSIYLGLIPIGEEVPEPRAGDGVSAVRWFDICGDCFTAVDPDSSTHIEAAFDHGQWIQRAMLKIMRSTSAKIIELSPGEARRLIEGILGADTEETPTAGDA